MAPRAQPGPGAAAAQQRSDPPPPLPAGPCKPPAHSPSPASPAQLRPRNPPSDPGQHEGPPGAQGRAGRCWRRRRAGRWRPGPKGPRSGGLLVRREERRNPMPACRPPCLTATAAPVRHRLTRRHRSRSPPPRNFDEGSGWRVRDATGRGHDLTATQTPRWEVVRWVGVCGNGARAGGCRAWRGPCRACRACAAAQLPAPPSPAAKVKLPSAAHHPRRHSRGAGGV